MKEKTRCVEVAGGVSLSVLEDLAWSEGRERAIAVWARASSRVLVGLLVRGSTAGVGSGGDVNVVGSILPMKVQRFLLGAVGSESVLSLSVVSVVSGLARFAAGRDCRFEELGCRPDRPCDEDELTIPSKPRNRLAAGIWLSFRMMSRRLPGAGWHGAVDGGRMRAFSADCFRKR